ncbi:MAG: hypothetical protein AAB365_03120 [Patescibacteria group bacterium]
MRHSFLPIQEQKTLKRGYRLHAAIVALFLMSVVGVVGICSLFPAYILVSAEERSQTMLGRSLEDADGSQSAVFARDLERDSKLVRALTSSQAGTKPSLLIQDVVSARASVSITSVMLSELSTTSATMIIQGIAPTRESLVSLKTRLENLGIGNKVELPISELAKSRDIPFSLRFTRSLP